MKVLLDMNLSPDLVKVLTDFDFFALRHSKNLSLALSSQEREQEEEGKREVSLIILLYLILRNGTACKGLLIALYSFVSRIVSC